MFDQVYILNSNNFFATNVFIWNFVWTNMLVTNSLTRTKFRQTKFFQTKRFAGQQIVLIKKLYTQQILWSANSLRQKLVHSKCLSFPWMLQAKWSSNYQQWDVSLSPPKIWIVEVPLPIKYLSRQLFSHKNGGCLFYFNYKFFDISGIKDRKRWKNVVRKETQP